MPLRLEQSLRIVSGERDPGDQRHRGQGQQGRQERRRRRLRSVGLQGESAPDAEAPGGDSGEEAQESDSAALPVAARQSQHHAEGTAEEHQHPDHDEGAQDEAERRGGAAPPAKLAEAKRRDERAQNEGRNLRA